MLNIMFAAQNGKSIYDSVGRIWWPKRFSMASFVPWRLRFWKSFTQVVTFETISRAASRFEMGLAFTTDSFFTAVPFLITLIFNFSVIVNSSLFWFTLFVYSLLCPGTSLTLIYRLQTSCHCKDGWFFAFCVTV